MNKNLSENNDKQNTDIHSCIFCESKNIEKKRAKMAPFIQARIGATETVFNLVHCLNCGGAFYDYRYTEKEIEKIYNKYRGEEYQQLRQKYESWYSKEINYLLGFDAKITEHRNTNLAAIIKNNIDVNKIDTVLDYGGDKGQRIPIILNNATKYVYEISKVEPCNNVKLLTSIADCKKERPEGFDLVICAHVFEHLSNPDEVIEIIKGIISSEGYLYIEVPLDSPFYKNPLNNIQYLFNKHFKVRDIIKKFIETKRTKYALMHEHINFYTKEALNILIKRHGLNPIFLEIKNCNTHLGNSKVISCLCKSEV